MRKDSKSADTPSRPVVRDFGQIQVKGTTKRQSQADLGAVTLRFLNRRSVEESPEAMVRVVKGGTVEQKRELSKRFVQQNGVYSRAVNYLADIYKFDSLIYPNLPLDVEITEAFKTKLLANFNAVLEYFDSSSIAMMCRKWATHVCIEGVYYGYICEDIKDRLVIQDLPANYCRTRFFHRGRPVVEFDLRYFQSMGSTPENIKKMVGLFPLEIQLGYYKMEQSHNGTISGEDSWLILDTNSAFKFNFTPDDSPPFLSAIPALLNLDEIQDIEKEKLLQELQKVMVQRFDLDKNGQLPYTIPELSQLNQNAVNMIGDAIGVSVLTTTGTVHMEDLASEVSKSSNAVATAENGVYNEFGISTNLFNTDGNLALEKSIEIDAAFAKQLLHQFEQFFNEHIAARFNKPSTKFRIKILSTTIFNYLDLAAKYESMTKIGFSRFLPMVALGHTQKEVVSSAKFEQQILELDNWMIPPFSSNTMSSDIWAQIKAVQRGELDITQLGQTEESSASSTPTPSSSTSDSDSDGEVGRDELPDDKKSEKTIANNESKG